VRHAHEVREDYPEHDATTYPAAKIWCARQAWKEEDDVATSKTLE
jgi:hypothetical protein